MHILHYFGKDNFPVLINTTKGVKAAGFLKKKIIRFTLLKRLLFTDKEGFRNQHIIRLPNMMASDINVLKPIPKHWPMACRNAKKT